MMISMNDTFFQEENTNRLEPSIHQKDPSETHILKATPFNQNKPGPAVRAAHNRTRTEMIEF